MDNISRNANEDTTTTMYLSFDAESTMSTACYKTLETMSDTSNLTDMNDSAGDHQANSTLEAHMNSKALSPLETVKKKIEVIDMKLNTPLKSLPKNILKEYKALCSTPSKEHLLKTVDVTRGSDATRCVDLGIAFLGIDDEKLAFFPPPILDTHEENKENAVHDIEEVSTLSTCSSVETITSIIEKKMCSLSTVSQITEAEPVDDMKIIEKIDKFLNSGDKVTKELSSAVNSGCQNPTEKNCNLSEVKVGDVEIIPNSNNDKCIVEEQLTNKQENIFTTSGVEMEEKIKPQSAVLNRKSRLSVCEPNLQTGKPSRILSFNNNRRSLLPKIQKSTTNINADFEIPQLINKMLKITDKNVNTCVNTEQKQKDTNQVSERNMVVDKRRSLVSTIKTRTSLLTSGGPSNKRPFSFTQRMSVVVKTTLNSPARKIARRSALSNLSQSTQRKPVTHINSCTDSSNSQKQEFLIRKSMLPKSSGSSKISDQARFNTLGSLEDTSAKTMNASSQRKSLYPLTKTLEKGKFSQRKPDISYMCNVCKDTFRVKSLLDAHKRSHESDNSPPAFIKKPSAIKQPLSGALLGNQNQCKYCDKKFALIKALHIHLLQNCSKIPPSEKRKLQYTDLNHVEKAQLPHVFPNHNMQCNAISVSERHRYPINKNITKTSSESLNEKEKITSVLKPSVNGNNSTASQTSHKVNKFTAHAGVYKTPSKAVPCHLCKLTFKSILDYTNHNLASHGNNKTGAVDDTRKDVEKLISEALPKIS